MGNLPAGIGTLVVFIVITGLLMSLIDGSFFLMLFLIPGILVGLLAAKSIR